MGERPDRNLALELVRVTEMAAVAAARWQGRGDKNGVDQAAVDAMRTMLSSVDMDGIVVIGEGEKDEAPMLFNGERVGNGSDPKVDVAVDPVDGTRLTALGQPGALAVLAMAERGSMYSPGHLVYMDKIVVGEEAAGSVDINAPVAHNLAKVAKAQGKAVSEVTAVILDRPRNEGYMQQVREAGARIALIGDGDISAAIATTKRYSGIDILFGIGGSPEAVTAACAMAALRGEMQCKLWPRDEGERQLGHRRRARPRQGVDPSRPGRLGQHVLRRHRGHRRRPAPGCRVLRGSRRDAFGGDALVQRDGPLRRRPVPGRPSRRPRRPRGGARSRVSEPGSATLSD